MFINIAAAPLRPGFCHDFVEEERLIKKNVGDML